MKQYNWTHEYQQRKKGIYEVRYLEFKGKVFYYNEALTKKMELEPSSFDSLLELFYFSYLPFIVTPFPLSLYHLHIIEP